jgi:hypothetical protein
LEVGAEAEAVLCVWTECSSIWASIFCPTPAGSCLRLTTSAFI